MEIVAEFDPASASSGSFIIAQSAASGKLVVYNESDVALRLDFQNGYSSYVPPWTGRLYQGNFGGQAVRWSELATMNATDAPLSLVIAETYSAQECLLDNFPAVLIRHGNAGNTITTTVVGVSTLQNDGNAANTQFIEATVLGDSASAVTLTNDGKLTLGTATHPGSVSFDNAKITSNGSGALTAAQISAATPLASLGDLPATSGITTRFGTGLHGSTDAGFESATFAVVAGEQGALFKQNNYFDGTNHRFMSAATAYQFDFGGSVSGILGVVAVRTSTNSPSTTAIITWSSWQSLSHALGPVGSGVQTVTNGATLTLSSTNGVNQLTASGGVSGLIMPMGSTSGQVAIFVNQSTFSLTFAVHGTSNVINGTGVSIGPFKAQLLIWNPQDGNQWYPV